MHYLSKAMSGKTEKGPAVSELIKRTEGRLDKETRGGRRGKYKLLVQRIHLRRLLQSRHAVHR